MNKVVYLGTTLNCAACRIQERILEEVLEDRSDVCLKVCDYLELPDFIQTNVLLEDFPVIVFIKDEIIKYTVVGTLSAKKIKRLMEDIEF